MSEVYGRCVPVQVGIITSYFDARKVTWNTAPGTVPTSCAFEVHFQNVGGYVDVDVSDLVYGCICGKIPNNELALEGGRCIRESIVTLI